VLLRNHDYDIHYLGGDHKLRKHRSALDSKYGVCSRLFVSMLADMVERYGGDDCQVHLIVEAGAKNQGAVQLLVGGMYDIAPDRARFISPYVTYAEKRLSPGVQAADLLVYPGYVLERENRVEVDKLYEGFPDDLPREEVTSFRAQITPQTLVDLKSGQIELGGLRRRLGRHWSHLDGFPKGWTAQPLELGGFVLAPPRSSRLPQQEAGSHPERPEPIGFVHLECE
jgi:hypothetical protein